MANEPPMGMGMHMGDRRGPPIDITMKMKLSPPIANTADEINMFARSQHRSTLDDQAIELIRGYLNNDPEPTDREIIGYLRNDGYASTVRDIYLARRILETE